MAAQGRDRFPLFVAARAFSAPARVAGYRAGAGGAGGDGLLCCGALWVDANGVEALLSS